MTTIAYREGVLAADSQATFSGAIEGRVVKIAARGGVLAAVCGSGVHGRAFLDWFRLGMRGDCPNLGPDENNAWGFVYPGNDQVLWFSRCGVEDFRSPFHAAGSGSEYALGAMQMGASAEEAVRVATCFDINSSAPITVLRRAVGG